jgi:outer membrane beta-barrel protein
MKRIIAMILASAFTLGSPAIAAPNTTSSDFEAPVLSQDAEDDDLDEILGESGNDRSVGEERRDFERDAEREETEVVELPEPTKKVIKTLQKKTFLKLGRGEFMPYAGMITNDPFIRRILFGANIGYHITEIFQFELQGSFSPNFKQGDHKAITRQIVNSNQVAPEISRMMYHVTANFNFSPFYGKVATIGRSAIIFDIYGTAGAGIVGTEDDLEIVDATDDPLALATHRQVHPAITFGGGVRVAFTNTFGLRFEVRSLSYINAIESTNLELKNNLTLILGASIFFGRRVQ